MDFGLSGSATIASLCQRQSHMDHRVPDTPDRRLATVVSKTTGKWACLVSDLMGLSRPDPALFTAQASTDSCPVRALQCPYPRSRDNRLRAEADTTERSVQGLAPHV